MSNSFIKSIRQQIADEIDLAWEQLQNGGSVEAKEEGRTAYNYLNTLLIKLVRDARNNYMIPLPDMMEDEDDND